MNRLTKLKFIDTHCHADFPPLSQGGQLDIDLSNICKIIVPTVDRQNVDRVLTLTNLNPKIYAALGLHPIYQHQIGDIEYLAFLLDKAQSKVVAIGEIGLDNYLDDRDESSQRYFLEQQLDLAKQYHLPVMLHSRKAHNQIYQILNKTKLANCGVIHGFSGSYQEAMGFIKLGYFIGVGGLITYPRANKTRQTISQIPLEFIVLETDAPDMPINGHQGEANRPEYIAQIFEALIDLRPESPQLIYETILANSLRLFPKLQNK